MLSLAAWPPAAAASPDSARQAEQLDAAAATLAAASAGADALRALPASDVAVDRLRQDLQLARADFAVREAVRHEQATVYEMAARPELQAGTLALVHNPHTAGLDSAAGGLRATWRLVGLGEGGQRYPRYSHRAGDAEPPGALLGYYRAAAARTGVDWSYLAAINYVESDFGRVRGPSSAGALGPMQFLPSTWREYGGDGDILSARDSIQAAALLLARNGAPGDYDRAILRYNHDDDYVAAVKAYAAALRSDPLWLTRLYYWSTFG